MFSVSCTIELYEAKLIGRKRSMKVSFYVICSEDTLHFVTLNRMYDTTIDFVSRFS